MIHRIIHALTTGLEKFLGNRLHFWWDGRR